MTDITAIENQAAATYNVPTALALDLFSAESGNDPNAVNPTSGALGLGQILPSTAANPGYGISPLTNPFDPTANANFALAYLSALYHKLGSWVAAVTAYRGTDPGTGMTAATDPNYAATYQAAQMADAGTLGMASALSAPNFETQATTAPQTIKNTNLTPSLSSIGSYLYRGGLIVLGIGLVLVAVMALARRSDVVTEGKNLASRATR